LHEPVSRHQAGLMGELLAVFEQEECGDAANAKASWRLTKVRIHLEKNGLAGEALSSIGKMRRHHPARTTPRRPNVENHQTFGVRQVFGECFIIDADRGGCDELGAALAAFRGERIAARGNAIARAARWARDLSKRRHGFQVSGLTFLMPSVSITSFS
jgi:hypothetical protein